jgi:hypothetical protein
MSRAVPRIGEREGMVGERKMICLHREDDLGMQGAFFGHAETQRDWSCASLMQKKKMESEGRKPKE